MRTSVTLDPDLAANLQALARERGVSFNEAVNSTLRHGLTSRVGSPGERYRLASRPLKLRPRIDLEHSLQLASELEDAHTIGTVDARE